MTGDGRAIAPAAVVVERDHRAPEVPELLVWWLRGQADDNRRRPEALLSRDERTNMRFHSADAGASNDVYHGRRGKHESLTTDVAEHGGRGRVHLEFDTYMNRSNHFWNISSANNGRW